MGRRGGAERQAPAQARVRRIRYPRGWWVVPAAVLGLGFWIGVALLVAWFLGRL